METCPRRHQGRRRATRPRPNIWRRSSSSRSSDRSAVVAVPRPRPTPRQSLAPIAAVNKGRGPAAPAPVGPAPAIATEGLHAKQQEAARKEAERAAREAPQDAAADAKGEAGEPASKKKGSAARSSRPPGRPAIGGRACRAQAGRPGDGRWDTGTRRRRPAAQGWRCCGSTKSPNSPCRARAARWLGSPRGNAGVDEAIGTDAAGEHAAKIGALGRLVESQPPGSSAI
jgi:hypothetical protein